MSRLRCFLAKKQRKQVAAAPQTANEPAATATTRVPTLAAVLAAEGEGKPAHESRGPQKSEPIMSAFPAGYESGQFRLVPGGVLIAADGMPTLRIEEGEQLSP
jgi:hypothetical protein